MRQQDHPPLSTAIHKADGDESPSQGREPVVAQEVLARAAVVARATNDRLALAEPIRTPEALLAQLDALRSPDQRRDIPAVIVIDQLEVLLADTRPASTQAESSEGEWFLAVLRTDALVLLQTLRPELMARAHAGPHLSL